MGSAPEQRTRPHRLLLVVGAVLALLLSSASARAQTSQAEFEKGKNAYNAKDFTDAAARFRAMLDAAKEPLKESPLLQETEMYYAAAKLAREKRTDTADPLSSDQRAALHREADRALEDLVLANPAYEADPLVFPTFVLNALTDAKTRLRDVLNQRAIEAAKEKARLEQLEKDLKAQQEAYVRLLEAQAQQTVEHHSRWLALVPFGAGQYQNGKIGLGTFFLGLETACIIGSGVTFIMYRLDISRGAEVLAEDSTSRDRLLLYQQYSDRAGTTRIVNLAFLGVAALTAAVGIIEAQINYVPDSVTSTKRPLPVKPPLPVRNAWLVPTFVPILTEQGGRVGVGGTVGIAGTF